MKTKDVKILWGRSGNRCAFPGCKIELTPDSAESSLGEMAHIVAESPNGPRGDSYLTCEERDEYSNLILLCPTHHTLIDSNPEEWTVDKLKQIKREHENWVSTQLAQNRIFVERIDNSSFIETQKKEWAKFAENYVWIIVSITPLNISNDDAINPLNRALLNSINSLKLLNYISYSEITVNHYHTSPNEYGVVNQDLRNIKEGSAHKIQVFRNGHCEFMVCLENILEVDSDHTHHQNLLHNPSTKILFYKDMAESLSNQIEGLINIWNDGLPFKDMLITAVMTNTTYMRLYSGRKTWNGYELGSPVSDPILQYSKVINKEESKAAVEESFIKRFVNHFGLNIDTVFDNNGNMNKPGKLY
ncbi:HNH endonuclease [Coleofasciculus sp. FACHB-SPT36]|uniref:HNH endonuclease n=1 Tax=Cyanophyceae TaxID=3028117 RepID=UPI00168B3418|nr:HNH endonuclease [Coleofasciculus sp. FACHB-SPT36]MBD2540597.1 hypothetical protein [Coleofasciculus sp. FACHB-SPT36]